MSTDHDLAAGAIAADLAAAWVRIADALDAGWSEAAPGVTAVVTGARFASLNPILVTDEADEDDVERLVERVAATRLPFSLTARPHMGDRIGVIARRQGLKPDVDGIPLMAAPLPLVAPGGPSAPSARPAPAFRVLAPEEAVLHAEVVAAVFTMTEADTLGLIAPAVVADPMVDVYVDVPPPARVTALSVRTGATAGVFDVGTRPDHRKQGLGEAIMRHLLAAAADRGARAAWLQSTAMAESLYGRIGFETLERWPSWRVL